MFSAVSERYVVEIGQGALHCFAGFGASHELRSKKELQKKKLPQLNKG
jgi:hypothetical protein